MLALKPSHCWWHRQGEIGSVREAAWAGGWQVDDPGAWIALKRVFRDGHEEQWWALEAEGGFYGPERVQRLVIVTSDPAQLSEQSTWYLTTNLPAPQSPQASSSQLPVADLAEVVRLYGLRIWVEQSYKQVKGTLGWAEYQARDEVAIRRHWQLVYCAFSFCWWALGQEETLPVEPLVDTDQSPLQVEPIMPPPQAPPADQRKKKRPPDTASSAQLAGGTAHSPSLAGTIPETPTILASLVQRSSTCRVTRAA